MLARALFQCVISLIVCQMVNFQSDYNLSNSTGLSSDNNPARSPARLNTAMSEARLAIASQDDVLSLARIIELAAASSSGLEQADAVLLSSLDECSRILGTTALYAEHASEVLRLRTVLQALTGRSYSSTHLPVARELLLQFVQLIATALRHASDTELAPLCSMAAAALDGSRPIYHSAPGSSGEQQQQDNTFRQSLAFTCWVDALFTEPTTGLRRWRRAQVSTY
jgi:hypothetical protein